MGRDQMMNGTKRQQVFTWACHQNADTSCASPSTQIYNTSLTSQEFHTSAVFFTKPSSHCRWFKNRGRMGCVPCPYPINGHPRNKIVRRLQGVSLQGVLMHQLVSKIPSHTVHDGVPTQLRSKQLHALHVEGKKQQKASLPVQIDAFTHTPH